MFKTMTILGTALLAVCGGLMLVLSSKAELDPVRHADRVAEHIPYVMGSSSETHGPLLWAISDGADFNTGNKVCAFEGYTCKAVIAYSNGMIASKINCNVETSAGKIGLVACK